MLLFGLAGCSCGALLTGQGNGMLSKKPPRRTCRGTPHQQPVMPYMCACASALLPGPHSTAEEFGGGHAPGARNVPVMLKGPAGMSPNPEFVKQVGGGLGRHASPAPCLAPARSTGRRSWGRGGGGRAPAHALLPAGSPLKAARCWATRMPPLWDQPPCAATPHLRLQFEKAFPEKTAPIVVGCLSGKRSLMAADLLSAAGYTNLKNVEGGYQGECWLLVSPLLATHCWPSWPSACPLPCRPPACLPALLKNLQHGLAVCCTYRCCPGLAIRANQCNTPRAVPCSMDGRWLAGGDCLSSSVLRHGVFCAVWSAVHVLLVIDTRVPGCKVAPRPCVVLAAAAVMPSQLPRMHPACELVHCMCAFINLKLDATDARIQAGGNLDGQG